MNPSRAPLDSLLATKRAEWSEMLLRRRPHLRQPLQRAFQILSKRSVTPLDSSNTYRVRGNPHDYVVHLAARKCSCGNCNCEHLLAAWFAFSQNEIVREQQEAVTSLPIEQPHGIWHGTNKHECADGYCGADVFGYGDSVSCARCGEMYAREHDATL